MVGERQRSKAYWEHFPHEADMGIRGIGANLEEAFAQAALAMTAVITDPRRIVTKETINVTLSESDRELLFVDFLNAIIFEMAERHMLFGQFQVTLDNDCLTATAGGETIDVERHQPAVEIKGATYTELEIKQLNNGLWSAQCVVDV